jgi:alkylation response protein AidB-like acyl-CoA dehydrogenase
MGFLGINVAEKYGGFGLGNVEALIVLEEVAKISGAVAFPVFESCMGRERRPCAHNYQEISLRLGSLIETAWQNCPTMIQAWLTIQSIRYRTFSIATSTL